MALSWSINAPTVSPAIATIVTSLLLIGLILVVALIVRIKVTVFMSGCQARVFSSSEGCSTSQKTVKVEAY